MLYLVQVEERGEEEEEETSISAEDNDAPHRMDTVMEFHKNSMRQPCITFSICIPILQSITYIKYTTSLVRKNQKHFGPLVVCVQTYKY